jgi:uncharacterized Fe-S center protein
VVPDIGIFCSPDIVAVDKASIDAVNKALALSNTINDEREKIAGDVFTSIHPTTDWRIQLEHAEKIGLGTTDYKLIEVK